MMDHYYASKIMDKEGYHIVHTQHCQNMPEIKDALYLGYFSNGSPAVYKAKKYFELVRNCNICIKNKTFDG